MDQLLFQPVVARQDLQPFGDRKPDLRHGEFLQDRGKDTGDVLFFQLLAVHGHHADPVFLRQLPCRAGGRFGVRFFAVQKHDKRLSQLFQLMDGLLLRRYVRFPGDFPERAVGRHNDADRRMVGDDLLCAQLCRLGERDFVIEPGRLYQTLLVVFDVAGCAFYHIADAVDQAYLGLQAVLQPYDSRFLGHKLGLRGHDRLAGRTLRQLIPRALHAVNVLHIRQNHQIDEALYKRRFSCAHRPHDSDIDFAAAPDFNVFVYMIWFHKKTPLPL